MRIIALSRLRTYWQSHPASEIPLRSWYVLANRAQWRRPADIKASYRNASILPGNRVVFNIKGNALRLIVVVHYDRKVMYVRFVGTHAEYDGIDALTI